MNVVLVFLGGGLGAASRWLVSSQITSSGGFPSGTLAVNLLGCLAIGVASAYLVAQPRFTLFFVVGLLGGFTTFSSFGLDAWRLLVVSDYKNLVTYLLASNVIGILLVIFGHKIGTHFGI